MAVNDVKTIGGGTWYLHPDGKYYSVPYGGWDNWEGPKPTATPPPATTKTSPTYRPPGALTWSQLVANAIPGRESPDSFHAAAQSIFGVQKPLSDEAREFISRIEISGTVRGQAFAEQYKEWLLAGTPARRFGLDAKDEADDILRKYVDYRDRGLGGMTLEEANKQLAAIGWARIIDPTGNSTTGGTGGGLGGSTGDDSGGGSGGGSMVNPPLPLPPPKKKSPFEEFLSRTAGGREAIENEFLTERYPTAGGPFSGYLRSQLNKQQPRYLLEAGVSGEPLGSYADYLRGNFANPALDPSSAWLGGIGQAAGFVGGGPGTANQQSFGEYLRGNPESERDLSIEAGLGRIAAPFQNAFRSLANRKYGTFSYQNPGLPWLPEYVRRGYSFF